MKCSALNVDFNGVRSDPIRSRSPPYESIKFGYPLENVRFLLLSSNLARERLQIDTDLLRIITSTADELSSGTSIVDFEPQNRGFSDFLKRLMAATHISRVNCVEITGDRPRQPANEIFSIKRRFKQCKFRPPRFKESSVRAHQIWVPLENVRFLLLSTNLSREWLQIDTNLLRIITSTADELSGRINIDDLERQ